MSYCPLMYGRHYSSITPCLGEKCALAADNKGECLIKQALQFYVNNQEARLSKEQEQKEQKIRGVLEYRQFMKKYFPQTKIFV